MTRKLRYALAALAVSSLAAACSAVQHYEEPSAGGGGSGGEAASSSSSGGGAASSSSSGVIPTGCQQAEDCAALNGNCHVGACINGLCMTAPAAEFGSCDDGQYCTEDDICVNGQCVGKPKFCASQDSCHLGVCDEALKTCKNVTGNEGGQCDDGDLCTQTGKCIGGVCSKGSPINCSIFDGQCSVGICDPVTGCKPIPKNDGVACNNGQGNGCSIGICQGGFCASVPQNDGVACNNGSVDGCSYGKCQGGLCASVPQADGTPCNDNLFCTENDKCKMGTCGGDPKVCPTSGPCMVGICNEFNAFCSETPGNNGVACEDGSVCTGGETCLNGQCVGGQPTNDGADCDDADGCTGGTTCSSGKCTNAQSMIGQCAMGDQCCPAGCDVNNDPDCLYWVSGVQQNVNPGILSGWTKCWSGGFGDNFPQTSQILQQCSKSKLLMACRPVGAQNFTLMAMGPRVDVIFDCGQQQACTKQSNGVGWYYSNSWSWGFAQGGEPVQRNSCDVAGSLPDLRMCWHSGGGNINTGYRCGNNFPFDNSWERLVYQAD